MDYTKYLHDGSDHFDLSKCPTNIKVPSEERTHYHIRTENNIRRMAELQDRLYAEAREGVIVLFQAMDAAGKDSTIRRVMSGLNPQGVIVHSYKQPSQAELAHDYLWRAIVNLPQRGYIGLLNRSYYEDVLVTRVHSLEKGYRMPERTIDMGSDEFYELRYRQISDFERYLYENGYRILKIMLHVSRKEQRKRFLERIDNPAKNWKFSSSDLAERKLWDQYQMAYQDAIESTAKPYAPWMVVPADQKWVMRYLVSEAVMAVLQQCNPHYPEMPDEQRKRLSEYRKALVKE